MQQQQKKSIADIKGRRFFLSLLGPNEKERNRIQRNRKKERTKYETLWLLLVRQTEKLDRKIEK
jgi:hypothetical protein